ncbi:MAG: hypothetical protein ACYC5K_03855, partial [Saccharofermentanales bacterium]
MTTTARRTKSRKSPGRSPAAASLIHKALSRNKIVAAALAICAALIFLPSCSKEGYIGDIVFSAPVTAVVFETGTDNGEPFSGIVYRKVIDYEKLLA